MENREKDEQRKDAAEPVKKPSSFRLDIIEKSANLDSSKTRQPKSGGIALSVPSSVNVPYAGKKAPTFTDNPWKAAESSSFAPPGSGEEPAREAEVVTADKQAEQVGVDSVKEATAPVNLDDKKNNQTGEPASLMEVFMAAKKRGKPPKKSSARIAMGDALDKQEKKSSAIEKMLDKNIAVETLKAKAGATSPKVKTSAAKSKPKSKRALADIVSEVASRKGVKKKAPRAAKVTARPAARVTAKATVKPAAKVRVTPKKAAPRPAAKAAPPRPRPQAKPRPQARPVRAASDPVDVAVESLASGLISLLGGAVDTVMGASKVAGQAVSSGAQYVAGSTKSAAEKIKKTVKRDSGAKSKKDEGPVAAAAKTAAEVTEKAAAGLSSIATGAVKVSGQTVLGVATVAGYTVKGGVAIVADTANVVMNATSSLLNMVLGSKLKRRKAT